MLSKPGLSELRALHQLVRTPLWPAIDKLLGAELDAIHAHLVNVTDNVTLHELRGRAKHINEFRGLASKTQDILEKLEA